MRRNTLLIDAAVAVLLAVLTLILAPGLAVVGMIALLVLVICVVSFVLDGRRQRSRGTRPRRPPSRRPPPRRPASGSAQRSRHR
jgi:hypothetical protein